MKELTFLKKLKRKRIIELVEPSEEIKLSYLTKAENCLKSAKILSQSQLYENSTSEAYYCMYNSLLSLLIKIGIKSENHSASIILFDKTLEEGGVYHLWGHSWEIDKNEDWNRLERVFKYISGVDIKKIIYVKNRLINIVI